MSYPTPHIPVTLGVAPEAHVSLRRVFSTDSNSVFLKSSSVPFPFLLLSSTASYLHTRLYLDESHRRRQTHGHTCT